MKGKLPEPIQELVDVFVKCCPICGPVVDDNRFKIEGPYHFISPLIIRKWTGLTLTRECIRCGLRFNVRWVTICNSLKKSFSTPEIPEEIRKNVIDRIEWTERYFALRKK